MIKTPRLVKVQHPSNKKRNRCVEKIQVAGPRSGSGGVLGLGVTEEVTHINIQYTHKEDCPHSRTDTHAHTV